MVDKSLSRGLADRVLDQMTGLAKAYIADWATVYGRIPRTRHAVRETTQRLVEAGEKAALTQLVGAHHKWRWASICSFLPEVVQCPEYAHNRTLAFIPLRSYVHVDRVAVSHCERAPAVAIQEHAVERLFLRLNVLDAAAVREEMHDATCLSASVLAACKEAGLRQVALPTQSGAFLCSLEKDVLIAKTWIPKSGERGRHTAVIEIVERFYQRRGGAEGVAAMIASLPIHASIRDVEPDEELAQSLGRINWLREEYQLRPDPRGDVWRNAQWQAQGRFAA